MADRKIWILTLLNIAAFIMVLSSISIAGRPSRRKYLYEYDPCAEKYSEFKDLCRYFHVVDTAFAFTFFTLLCSAVACGALLFFGIDKGQEFRTYHLYVRIPSGVGALFMLINLIMVPLGFNIAYGDYNFFAGKEDGTSLLGYLDAWGCNFVAFLAFIGASVVPFFITSYSKAPTSAEPVSIETEN